MTRLTDPHLKSALALLLGMAYGSAMGIPRGYSVTHNSPVQSTDDRLARTDKANAKRARKAERNRRLLERAK